MVAADELDVAGDHPLVGIVAVDLAVVIDRQAVALPGPAFGDDVHEGEVAR